MNAIRWILPLSLLTSACPAGPAADAEDPAAEANAPAAAPAAEDDPATATAPLTAPGEEGIDERPAPTGLEARWLLWVDRNDDPAVSDLRTVLVEQRAGGATVAGEYTGLLAAMGASIFRASEAHQFFGLADCTCVEQAERVRDAALSAGLPAPEARSCEAMDMIPRPALAEDGALEPWASDPIRSAAESGAGGAPGERAFLAGASTSTAWIAQAGPVLVAMTCTHEMACGAAHGNSTCRADAFDTRQRRWIEAPQLLAGARVQEPAADAVNAAWRAAHDRDDASARGERVLIYPTLNADAELVWTLRYAFPDCYACSDGGWSSYTSTVNVPITPTSVDDVFAPPPAAVVQAAQGALGRMPAGWSRFDGEPSALVPPPEPERQIVAE